MQPHGLCIIDLHRRPNIRGWLEENRLPSKDAHKQEKRRGSGDNEMFADSVGVEIWNRGHLSPHTLTRVRTIVVASCRVVQESVVKIYDITPAFCTTSSNGAGMGDGNRVG